MGGFAVLVLLLVKVLMMVVIGTTITSMVVIFGEEVPLGGDLLPIIWQLVVFFTEEYHFFDLQQWNEHLDF